MPAIALPALDAFLLHVGSLANTKTLTALDGSGVLLGTKKRRKGFETKLESLGLDISNRLY